MITNIILAVCAIIALYVIYLALSSRFRLKDKDDKDEHEDNYV